MKKTVYDLTEEEDEIPTDIPDDIIYEHYKDVVFTDEDFE